MAETKSSEMTPGTRLRWMGPQRRGTNAVVVLERRKQPGDNHHGLPFHEGWWVEDGGGLADFVIDADDSRWKVVSELQAKKPQQ